MLFQMNLEAREQISKLQADLQEQMEAAKQRESMADETRTKLLALEAESLQLQKDSEKDAKDREDSYKYESEARARDQASRIIRLQTLGERNLEQATAEKMQLQLDLQNELADKAGEIQALQARLEKITNEYQDYKLTMDARQQELGDSQSTDENNDALGQENLTLQTTLLDEQNESTKRQDLKAQDSMIFFETLRLEIMSRLQKDSEQTVEELQAAYELEREGQAADKSSAARNEKDLQEKARQYIILLEEQGRAKTELVRNELTNLVAEKEALISNQQAIIDHDRKPSLARLRETEGITDNIRIRLEEKEIEVRNADAMLARQNKLIAKLSADRGSVKALSQQALELLRRRAAAQVGRLTNRVAASSTSQIKKKKKYRAMPQTARDGNDDFDGKNDDRSDQEEENDDDVDSDFADWHDDPEG